MSSLESPQLRGKYISLLKALAVVGSLSNAGAMTTAYRLLPSTYPTAHVSRRMATKEWAFYYRALSQTVPLTDLATILICSGVAYVERKHNAVASGWKLWATAAGIMPLGWLWVWTLMLEPSNRLLDISNSPDALVDGKHPAPSRTIELMKTFNSLMGVRAMFPWVVGMITLSASMAK